MEHTLKAEGFGVRLRPVRMEDAAFIVWLRNLDHVKGRVGDSATDTAGQEAWLRAYFQRDGDYYFIIETAGGLAIGAYGIYNVKGVSAESGRWIIRPEVPAAVPSALLAFDLAFGGLRLKEVRVTTVSTNHGVLSLNRKFGFREVGIERGGVVIGGQPVDLVRFVMSAEEWTKPRERMLPMARLAATQVQDWEKAQSKDSAVEYKQKQS
jgi:RimJ/RimL family protein N-acetyltransferase